MRWNTTVVTAATSRMAASVVSMSKWWVTGLASEARASNLRTEAPPRKCGGAPVVTVSVHVERDEEHEPQAQPDHDQQQLAIELAGARLAVARDLVLAHGCLQFEWLNATT